jgi:hypothetical protein
MLRPTLQFALLSFLIFFLGAPAPAQCVSESPDMQNPDYTGWSASVTPPPFNPGDTLQIFVGGFTGPTQTVVVSDSGFPQQSYQQASGYAPAVTGNAVAFEVPVVTSTLAGNQITAAWQNADGSTGTGAIAPTITVCDFGPNAEIVNPYVPSTIAGYDTTSLTSQFFQDFDVPATEFFFVSGGLTQEPEGAWTVSPQAAAAGWSIATYVNHAALAVRQTTRPNIGRVTVDFDNILHSSGVFLAYAPPGNGCKVGR